MQATEARTSCTDWPCRQGDAGMAGGSADPAALLRLYMRFGCMHDALALAHAHISAWLVQACTSCCWHARTCSKRGFCLCV